jgi:hypothetical protein
MFSIFLAFNSVQVHLIVNHLAVVGWIGVLFLIVAHSVQAKSVSRKLIFLLGALCGIFTLAAHYSGHYSFRDSGLYDESAPIYSLIEAHEEQAEAYDWFGMMGGIVALIGLVVEWKYRQWRNLFWGVFAGVVLVIVVALVQIAHLGGMIRHEWLR